MIKNGAKHFGAASFFHFAYKTVARVTLATCAVVVFFIKIAYSQFFNLKKYQPQAKGSKEIVMLLVRIIGQTFDARRVISDSFWYRPEYEKANRTLRGLFDTDREMRALIEKSQNEGKMLEYEFFRCSKEFFEADPFYLFVTLSIVPVSDLIGHSGKRVWKKTVWKKKCTYCKRPIRTIKEGASSEDVSYKPTCGCLRCIEQRRREVRIAHVAEANGAWMKPRAIVILHTKNKMCYNTRMNTLTIPRGFIVIPRAEYEELRARPPVREFKPTKNDLKALERARRNFHAGKSISLAQLERDLANRR
ncbi:MAG: hypothetical protein V1711_03120 [bacterium]